MEMMQRAYVLRRKNGELIFLFEERALATGMASTMFADIVTDLAARAGISIRELGTVEGKGGLLEGMGNARPRLGGAGRAAGAAAAAVAARRFDRSPCDVACRSRSLDDVLFWHRLGRFLIS